MVPEIVLSVVVLIGLSYDLKERRIPNWITVPGLGAGLVLHGADGGAAGLIDALGGASAGAALLAIPFAFGWVGGGDLKLMAAVGALMGARFAFWALIFGSLAGGLMAVGWLAITGSLISSLTYLLSAWRRHPGPKPTALAAPIAFGPALAVGVLASLLWR